MPNLLISENAKTVASCIVDEIVDSAKDVEFADIVEIAEIVKIGQKWKDYRKNIADFVRNTKNAYIGEVADIVEISQTAGVANLSKIHEVA